MSKIQWTDVTWNPTTGCDKVSPGCKNCYAERMHKRLLTIAPHKYTKPFLHNIELHVEEIYAPLSWKKPRMVFVNSMSDLFHNDVPFWFIDMVFDCMLKAHWHTFQILTKRHNRLYQYFHWKWMGNGFKFDKWPLQNVWIGVSAENQNEYDERITLLRKIPAAVRFLSCEPLLGKIDLRIADNCMSYNCADFGPCKQCIDRDDINWIIAGGESGPNARLLHPDWVRSIRDQCKTANVPFFFKQWGEYIPHSQINPEQAQASKGKPIPDHDGYPYFKIGKSKSGNMLDGVQHLNFPSTLK